jgi:hypothetical protein
MANTAMNRPSWSAIRRSCLGAQAGPSVTPPADQLATEPSASERAAARSGDTKTHRL